MFTKILRASIALFTGLLVMSCDGGVGNNEPSPSSEGFIPPAPVERLRPGPAVEFADSKGYRFRLEGLRAANVVEVPEAGEGISEAKSAPPGTTFAYVDLLVTNLQTDRIAPLTDFLKNWYIQVPKQLDPDQSMIFCDNALPNFCGDRVSCLRLDKNGVNVVTRLGGFDDEVRIMPAGATWRLRCFLGTTLLGDIEGANEVSDSIKPPDIHFVRIVGKGLLIETVKERQEVEIPAV